nr:NAD(P)/FAD-dependent oxidoreductase [Kibdelosporangium sp. MJ126-NF4]CTQ98471.1 Salicylate hydroxylase (EC 1.14.13.1) [Kibdelosporangium sp. MJ126-NF4]
MRVLVIGAGIGGLVAAQGLRAAGMDVQVHERDTDLARTAGHRLHLNPPAVDVLRRRLDPPVFQALMASAPHPRAFRQFTVLDHRLRALARLPRGDDGDHLLIGRIPLRRLLGHGLDDVVRLGSEFVGLHQDPEGTVTARFADGSTDTADVLVGADGARSRVVAALTGSPTSQVLPSSGLAGRAALTDAVRAGLPHDLSVGPAFVLGPDGTAIFLSLHDPATAPIAADTCREVAAIVEPGYVLWGIIVPTTITESGPVTGTAALHRARDLLPGWSTWVHTLLDNSDPAQITQFPFYAADPDADLTPWQVKATTALGDAVHAMPPTGGQGAATAIRDADVLVQHLAEAHDKRAVALTLHNYQRAMARHAVPALRESLQPVRWQQHLTSRAGRPMLRALLPLVGAAAGLRHSPR